MSVIEKPYAIPDGAKISDKLKDLLDSCFAKNPDERISIDEVLAHKCFENLKKHHLNSDLGFYEGFLKDGKYNGTVRDRE